LQKAGAALGVQPKVLAAFWNNLPKPTSKGSRKMSSSAIHRTPAVHAALRWRQDRRTEIEPGG
jgi:hypothetical protein